jgi:HSP20 family protein
MALRDLIPWSRRENRLPAPVSVEQYQRDERPILSLHREVNRLVDDVSRGFSVPDFGGFEPGISWPHVELGETDKEIRVTAELPGLDEKDVDISLEDGVLTLRGEKRSEVEDKVRGYSKSSYGASNSRQLIELGGLVAKAGLVELTDDDRAVLFGAMLEAAARLQGDDREQALLVWRRRGKRCLAATDAVGA